MRIKFLSVIVSFLFVSLAITSCLDTNEDVIEYSSDATIHAFGIDTIHGRHYKFTIDQLNRLIYNADSLPVGSDTIIDRICIDTIMVTGWVTSGIADTLVNINDSIDLRQPIELNVHAADGITTRKYTIKVNVHKQDPDSLVWEKMGNLSATPIIGKQKSVILNGDQLFVYSSNTIAYKTSTNATQYLWRQIAVNLPADAKLASVVNFQEKLYMATNSGKVFRSADGATWEEVSTLSAQVVTLVTAYSKALVGIQSVNGVNKFCTSTDELTWVVGEEVPSDFPIEDIYSTVYTTATGMEKAFATGNVSEATKTVPWFSYMNDAGWASSATERDSFCPGMANPTIMYYGGLFYIFGGDFSAIYKSLTGIEWYKMDKKFLLPEAFKGRTIYSMTIDKNDYIWIVWGGNNGTASNEVWRGRLNKLGFKR